jgi:hypothetical protein
MFLRKSSGRTLRLVDIFRERTLLERRIGVDPVEAALDVIRVAEDALMAAPRTFRVTCGEAALEFQLKPQRETRMNVRVPDVVLQALWKIARDRNASVSDLVNEAVVTYYKIKR